MTVVPFHRPPSSNRPVPPLFNVPPLTLYTLAALLAIQLLFVVMPENWAGVWGYRLAFVPARYTGGVAFDGWALVSPFTHLFIHGGWMHVIMNGVMLLAFGTGCERMMGPRKTSLLFVACGLAGAAAQFMLGPTSPIPMIGASGALSGLFAVLLLRMQNAGMMATGRLGIWGVAALWVGLSFFTAFIGGSIGVGNVAWAAHAGGFIAGIALYRLRYFSA